MEQEGRGSPKTLVVFADVDGTILDLETYQPGPALESLQACEALGVAVVFVSSKTRQELEDVRKSLGNRNPFACENGAALFLPRSEWDRPGHGEACGAYWRILLGRPRAELLRVLREASSSAGVPVRAFHEMDEAELAEATGLSLAQARLAGQREFDEPFFVPGEEPAAVLRLALELEKKGYGYSRGGRFHHVSGKQGKGEAVRILKELYRARCPGVRFAAFGDAEADLPMLREVHHPFLVRRPDGTVATAETFSGLRVTQAPGPGGFAEGIRSLLRLYHRTLRLRSVFREQRGKARPAGWQSTDT